MRRHFMSSEAHSEMVRMRNEIGVLAPLVACGVFVWVSGLSLDAVTGVDRRDVLLGGLASLSTSSLVTAGPATSRSEETRPTPYLLPEYFTEAPVTRETAGRSFFPTLTPPFFHRATYRYHVGDHMWALEQLLAFTNVTATIRTNVVKLDSGGLWVHSPQWPTGEFRQLLDELGPVEHVVLPCNALEHKAPMKEFCKCYPDATVWITPGQYGPFGSCGKTLAEPCSMGYRVDGILADADSSDQAATRQPPWIDAFRYETFYVDIPGNAGPVSEVAFFHKNTKTLITVDALVFIPDTAPRIFQTYFDSETFHESYFWPKTVLQSVFLPLRFVNGVGYPGFEAIRNRLVRAPILRGFNDARAPELTKQWISSITTSEWNYDRIITSHFASPIAATSRDVNHAFGFLSGPAADPPIACEDWELLDALNDVIVKNRLGAAATFDYKQGCQ